MCERVSVCSSTCLTGWLLMYVCMIYHVIGEYYF